MMTTGNECEISTLIGKRKERNFKEEDSDSVSKKSNTGLRDSDSISLLHEDLLGKILSQLPTKEAALTSLLSRRWRNVFAYVDNLDFVFVNTARSDETLECFKNFVDRTLALRCGSYIKKFSLYFQNYKNSEMAAIYRWISKVVECGVLEMNLCITETELPSELFRSKTLQKLTLGSKLYLRMIPLDVFLPELKSLFIEPIFCDHHRICERLLAGCPVLEELAIRDGNYGVLSSYCICISSPTIKKLKVNYIRNSEICYISSLSIDAPNLVSLDYTVYNDFASSRYNKVNLKSLVEAKLDLNYKKTIERPDITRLIIGISNVKTLHLSRNTVNAMYRFYDGPHLPVFNNLVNLSFSNHNRKSWNLLLCLLKQSPKLEALTIRSFDGYNKVVSLGPFQVKVLHVLRFGNTSLEKAKLIYFVRGTESLELVKLEIKKGVVVDHAELSRTLKNILQMAAPKCNIELEIS